MKPRIPGDTEFGSSRLTDEPTDEPADAISMRPSSRQDPLADAGEQVVLGQLDLDPALGQLEVLGRPEPGLHLPRRPEEAALRVDLGPVRLERLVALLEVLRAFDP